MKMNKIISILKKNGFYREDTNHYISSNGRYSVEIRENDIAIANELGEEEFINLDCKNLNKFISNNENIK